MKKIIIICLTAVLLVGVIIAVSLLSVKSGAKNNTKNEIQKEITIEFANGEIHELTLSDSGTFTSDKNKDPLTLVYKDSEKNSYFLTRDGDLYAINYSSRPKENDPEDEAIKTGNFISEEEAFKKAKEEIQKVFGDKANEFTLDFIEKETEYNQYKVNLGRHYGEDGFVTLEPCRVIIGFGERVKNISMQTSSALQGFDVSMLDGIKKADVEGVGLKEAQKEYGEQDVMYLSQVVVANDGEKFVLMPVVHVEMDPDLSTMTEDEIKMWEEDPYKITRNPSYTYEIDN